MAKKSRTRKPKQKAPKGISPQSLDAVFQDAVAKHQQGQIEAAAKLYQRILTAQPNHAHSVRLLGLTHIQRNEPARGEALIRKAISLDPNFIDSYSDLGIALKRQGKQKEALACFRKVLSEKPDHSGARFNLGNTYREMGSLKEAKACYEALIAQAPQLAAGHLSLALVLNDMDAFAAAEESAQTALKLNPHDANGYGALGMALAGQGRVEEAITAYRKAVELNPDSVLFHANLGLCLLLAGRLEEAWPEYLWRHKMEMQSRVLSKMAQPLWDGSPLDGKTIVLFSEQGYGDTLQFVRYAKDVKARGGNVILYGDAILEPVLKDVAGVDAFRLHGKIPECDTYAPLLTLPGILGTTLETVPNDVPYLRAPEDIAHLWRERLSGLDGLKVGLCWGGNPGHGNDRNRSIPIEMFSPLFGLEGVHWFSLQVGERAQDITRVSPGAIEDLSNDINDFGDTAGLMEALDLIISADTAPVHLAGALGRPTWVLLPFAPDWRWLMGREDSPWYPTLRLFRQPQPKQWQPVLSRVASELQTLQRD